MASQPIRPGAAPAGRAAGAATSSVTSPQRSEPPPPAQAARLRLLPGSGQRWAEECPLVVFVGVGDGDAIDRRVQRLLVRLGRAAPATTALRDNG